MPDHDTDLACTQNNHLPAQVFLRPIGVSLPLGLAGLGIASLIDSGLALHWIPQAQTLQVGLILVSVPFALQLLACVLSYLSRDGATGTTLGVLATSWLAIGLLHITSPGGRHTETMGLLLLVAGSFIALSAFVVGIAKPLPGLVFFAAAARFIVAGIYQVSGVSAWQHAGGILGLVITGLAGYAVVAFELEGQRKATVLPTLRRGLAAAALRCDAPAQIDQIAHEPGVRQTT